MYAKILVPLDGSQLSERVLPHVRYFAKALKVLVELVQIIDSQLVTAFSDPQQSRYVDVVGSTVRDNSINYLERIAGSFLDPSTVICTAEIGSPAEVIVEKATANPGTLIAMSTHGRSGLQRWLLGSVADKVLHACANPLLLVRAASGGRTGEEAPLTTVLLPLDGSSLAELVLPHVAVTDKEMKLVVASPSIDMPFSKF